MPKKELKSFLDLKVEMYNRNSFIASDPIQVPHQFSKKEDIEIAGFLSATIAWGNRIMIIRNAKKMMEIMDNSPFDFIMNHSSKDLESITGFVHRTFNSNDLQYFIKSLQNIYQNHGGLESILKPSKGDINYQNSITEFKTIFFELQHEVRTEKHISNPLKNSAAKRIHMYLRWMVRKDTKGVDFGLWKTHSPAFLSCPLDVHSGNVARKLGILTRKQNDWKAVHELDTKLRSFDVKDPVKYDFALFGLGVFEKF
ncbi:TIGR02757 family protein [Flavobacteriaceae bacterium]|nr:TIGR02757 family protein [Flavobacteriaceae bacterium]MDA9992828.1 TIGR02757 family protein [Flavobacteriaceae bacterium]MDB2336832.1 TIGR02757 family protein [Flavobacteriaceae bacterium]MDB2491303.1 TIGR02757 family protein [Flavobacteriaceae bacterium]MDB2657980.1 TIGR02757 family protein [Flavobacteriaceae bacterium]